VNEYFTRSIAPKDVVWTYSGVRPLYDDGAPEAQEVTRDYVLSLDAPDGSPPLLNIVGGKITTFRRLAEAALATLAPFLPADAVAKAGWTRGASLPGGEFPTDGFSALVAEMRARHAYLAPEHAVRLARAYGTHAMLILHNTRQYADLGRRFGADLTEREVAYLMDHEWAVAAADVVWRRSKLGLRMSAVEIDDLDRWMADRATPQRITAAADSGAAS
jgi:glycerol-3-phosphate dehydrogenase